MQDTVTALVKYRDLSLDTDRRTLCRYLNLLGEEELKLLLEVKKALGAEDAKAVMNSLEELLLQRPAYRISDLAVTGTDLIRTGAVPGPELGRILEQLLEQVMEGSIENEKEPLLKRTEELIDG